MFDLGIKREVRIYWGLELPALGTTYSKGWVSEHNEKAKRN